MEIYRPISDNDVGKLTMYYHTEELKKKYEWRPLESTYQKADDKNLTRKMTFSH